MSTDTLYYFATFAFVPIALTAILGLIQLRKESNEKWMVALVCIACVSELVSSALWRSQLNNILISHIYTIIEFILLSCYFASYWGKAIRKWSLILSAIFAGFVLIYVFVLNDPYVMNSLPRTIESVIMIAFTLVTYRSIMQKSGENDLWVQPLFWINSGVLLYFSSNILLFYFSSYVASVENGLSGWIWTIHLIFMTIYYSLISIGLWKTPQTQR